VEEKIKVFVIADHPLSPSGVGLQTKYMIESCLATGKFKFICFGGAVKHSDYTPKKVDPHGEDWIIYPTDGYGDQEKVRSLLQIEKPDILWFMTDPRFFGWLWDIENEIRANVPMVYYHVWDNFPYPKYNKQFYDSNDFIATISKVTDEIVKNVSPDVERRYVPHSVESNVFKPLDKEEVKEFRHENMTKDDNKMVVFWNNRNARRKQSGSLIFWFKDFLDEVGHDNAMLIMHTDVRDPHGQDLEVLIKRVGLDQGQVRFSTQKISSELLALMYNAVDVTVNISDAEGFGLATLESLSCGTPIVVNMTGGLQEQVTDGEEFFGVGIKPASQAVIGSLEVPYIFEDRIAGEDLVSALKQIYEMSPEERGELGAKGREHVLKNYNFEKLQKVWPELLQEIHDKHGSWDTRKNYNNWRLIEV